jgi:integrase/recombinase XerD
MAREGQALALSSEHLRLFNDYIDGTKHYVRDKAIFLMTLRAGMRIGSVAQITLSDILDTSTKVKEVAILRKSITKGGKTITAYLSHPELREALNEWLKIRPKCKVDNLFVSQKRTAFSPNSMSQLMLKHYQRAGIEGASSHSGRISFCTALLKNKVDIVAVSKVMGHSSVLTTQRYVHHDQIELSNVVRDL